MGSYSYGGNSEKFIASMLRDDTTTYYGGFKLTTYVTSTSCNSDGLKVYLNNAGASENSSYGSNDGPHKVLWELPMVVILITVTVQ